MDTSMNGNYSEAVIVTGGSGYIGSVTARELVNLGYHVVIIDKKPLPHALTNCTHIQFVQGDYSDEVIWNHICDYFHVRAVIHLAALIEVGESVADPAAYYDNNVLKFIRMLSYVRKANISTIIAASSSAVYGNPCAVPIDELHMRNPLSPYGRTKVILEDILCDYHAAYGLSVAIMRFANVAGAVLEYGLGEHHDPETHLIPRVIVELRAGNPLYIYGNDYDTPDGTCLRDFVHVHDVARLQALLVDKASQRWTEPLVLNVGSGTAISVKEVIDVASEIVQKKAVLRASSRRPGDAQEIVLTIDKACQVLGWKPLISDIRTIIQSVYDYQCKFDLKASNGKIVFEPARPE